ncbi:lysine 2,3-aminomutase, partial [bacterium]|nr:lysine 2,3-aminomutase [bacterium]
MINKDLQSNLEKYIDGDITKTNWKSWKWQVKNTIRDIRLFEKLLDIKFDENKKNDYKAVFEKFPLSITPYYLSLIDKDNFENDPIFLQSFPKLEELITNNAEMSDPLAEDSDSPVPFITHRYPDRILFCISNTCAMY